ncbi:hypothetical protein SAMN05216251_102364 [Actinacidiphila alni]|uniref:Uncharacterized protein n=1 Tax=Actinacidiphila alni TaxID=380248 RepID=A0A1I1Z8V3_9ACTN|nr:hypothetical protein [Actinacidiphila alni]SFE28196.1 hypothetical protein SAMN05216251_102364 [Actinacidiphila alni]
MPDIAPEWHLSLTDSVYALGAAARELRTAHSHARHTAWAADPARIVPVVGLLTVPDAEPVAPHDEALWQLSDLYMVLEHHTHELYENAALGYAHGAAAAVAAVLRSERPRHVELPRDRHGSYAVTADGLPDVSPSLTRDAGSAELADLRTRVIACEPADGEEEFTVELADAAYAYGERAERTLQHLIRFADAHGFLQAG